MPDTEGAPVLPPGVALAWGHRHRGRPGPKPSLDLERIVAAGLEIADADGLERLSMSRLAGALGFTTMSLYRYVAGKDELVALLVDAAYGPPPPGEDADGWREGLERWSRALLAVYRAHRWLPRAPVEGPPLGPNNLAWLDRGLHALRATPLPEEVKPSIVLLLSSLVRASAQLAIDLERAFQAAAPVDYGAALAHLIDAERFPALSAAVDAGAFAPDEAVPDEEWDAPEFTFELGVALDGVAALIERSG